MTIPFLLPEHYAKYAGGRPLTADLIHRKGKWYLQVAVELPDPPAPPEYGPAVTSGNRFFGRRQWRGVEARYFRLRRLAGKVNRLRRTCGHVLSRRIAEPVDSGTVIVVENLTHIWARVKRRGREARRVHSWSFAQLRGFLEYKP